MRSSAWICWLALLWSSVAGCGDEICIRHSDCVAGQMCGADGLCAVAATTDATAANDAAEEPADAADTTTEDAGVDAPSDATETADGGP